MQWNGKSLGALCVGSLTLASCAGGGGRMVSDSPVRIGRPYVVNGKSYTPADIRDYDEVGYASWYGARHKGRSTANGEIFEPARISAAHTVLPLPSYVEVTALDTGRTIVVRVNDRGPFARGRIIDLSHAAAKQLGIATIGVAPVRVRRAYPSEHDRALLRSGRAAPLRSDASHAQLALLRDRLAGPRNAGTGVAPPPPAPAQVATATPVQASPAVVSPLPPSRPPSSPQASGSRGSRAPVNLLPDMAPPASAAGSDGYVTSVAAADSRYRIEVGAYADEAMARTVARQVGGVSMPVGTLWRVRTGPYADRAAADRALRQIIASGFNGAWIMIND